MVSSAWFDAPWVYLVDHPIFNLETITPFVQVPEEQVDQLELTEGQKLTFKIELRQRLGYDLHRFEDVCVDRLARLAGRYLLRLDPTPMHGQLRDFIFNRVSNHFKTQDVDVAARILDDVEIRLKFIEFKEDDPDLQAESTEAAAILARLSHIEDDPSHPGPFEPQ